MAAALDNNRWKTDPDEFAVRVHISDVSGFFSKQLVVEQGTRALIIDDGQYVGEVQPGTYTLQSFASRLLFWRSKQAVAILLRREDFVLEITCGNLPTAENLVVDATVRLAVQVEDVALFAQNLMGTRRVMTRDDVERVILPLMQQALWQAVGRLSITELTGPDAREQIDATVDQALGLSMRRYGLRFVNVQTVSIRHEKYDEQRRKTGEIFLERSAIEQQDALNKLYNDEELLKIRRMERENDLALLAQNVNIDRMTGEVNAELRRIDVRNRLRDAVNSEEFEKVKDEEDLKRFLHERDKGQLLRDEEMDDLVDGFQHRQGDRDAARKHMLAKIELDRRFDIDRVREQLDHVVKMEKLNHEIELSKQTASKANLQWQEEVEKERRTAENRRQERDKELRQQWDWARQEASHRREQEWDTIVQRQRADRLTGEVEIAQAERRRRVSQIEAELKAELDREQLETEKRRKAFELDTNDHEAKSQVEKLAAIQRLNQDAARAQQELQERQLRLDAELETLKVKGSEERELARIQALKGMSTEGLIATAATRNAELLADLKKHEATQQATSAQASFAARQAWSEEHAKLHEQLTAAERTKAEAIAQAYRDLMQAQQQTVQQSISALSGAAGSPHSSQPPVFIVPGAGTPGVTALGGAPAAQGQPASPPAEATPRIIVCTSCRTENRDTFRFCSSCGKPL